MLTLPLGITLFTCIVEMPLLLFHVSVAAFVASQYLSQNKKFVTGFYAIFIIQCFVDVGSVVMVRSPNRGRSQLGPIKTILRRRCGTCAAKDEKPNSFLT